MRYDHAAGSHSRGHLAQASRDVLVRQPVKPVSPYPLGVEALRNRETVCNGAMAAVKGRVEARDLKQFRTPLQQGADRRQVVRLMQRCERNICLEVRNHRLVNSDRPVVFRAAMDDPMADRDQVEALGLT